MISYKTERLKPMNARGKVIPQDVSSDAQNVMRQGFAGKLWSKQFYHYVIEALA